MKKLLYAALFVLGATAFWQCDDPEWESAAIGTWGAPEVSFPIAGGSTAVKFTATKGWSISIDYPEGAIQKDWCTVSPMSGGAGDNEITITAAQNETFEDRTVDVVVHSGSASKVYKVTMPSKNELAAEVHEFKDLSYEEQIIEVPLVSNVEYKVNISPEAQEWISQVESKAEPVKDTLYFKIETYRTGLLPRETSITLTNTALGAYEQIDISQNPGPTLVIDPALSEIDGKKQEVTVSLVSSAAWKLTQEEATAWCKLTGTGPEGEKGEYELVFSVEEALTKARTAVFTLTADTMVRTITIQQTELGVENGAFIYKGDAATYSNPSVFEKSGNLIGLYTYPYKLSASQAELWAANSGVTGGEFRKGTLYVHFVLDLPASNMKQSIRGEGWGSTSKMVFKLYRWDTDYNTTLAGDPIITNTIPYTEGKHYDMLPSGKTVAPGEYMLSLEATDIDINNPQYWSWGKANEEFVKGAWYGKEEMTANFPEFYCVYDTKVNGSGQVACKTSTDLGKTWKDQADESFAALSKKWLGDYTVASNFNITTFDGYYYVTFDKAGDKGICVTRCKIAGGDWESWNGSGWSADGKATVWTSSTPVSLVGKDGAVYAYYMDGDNVVSVKYAGGDNWPASGQQSVGYVFTEDAPAEIDVKYHAGSSEYVATYVTADREIGTLTSTDGVRFTVADPLPVDSYYLWAGASGVRYAVDAATGTVKAKSYISYKRGEGTKGLYAFPEK